MTDLPLPMGQPTTMVPIELDLPPLVPLPPPAPPAGAVQPLPHPPAVIQPQRERSRSPAQAAVGQAADASLPPVGDSLSLDLSRIIEQSQLKYAEQMVDARERNLTEEYGGGEGV